MGRAFLLGVGFCSSLASQFILTDSLFHQGNGCGTKIYCSYLDSFVSLLSFEERYHFVSQVGIKVTFPCLSHLLTGMWLYVWIGLFKEERAFKSTVLVKSSSVWGINESSIDLVNRGERGITWNKCHLKGGGESRDGGGRRGDSGCWIWSKYMMWIYEIVTVKPIVLCD